MILPDEFELKPPYHNGFEDENDPLVLKFIAEYNYLLDRILNGTLFIKFIDGDRKGSIAKFKPSPQHHPPSSTAIRYRQRWSSHDKNGYDFTNTYFYGIATWTGRSNKPQVNLPNRDIIILPNYTGPTVWALFDHKAAKAEALKEPDQVDIDGHVLAIGDPVIYINARYGSGMELCHGVIKEFKASVDSRKTEIFTIVTNIENNVESKISNSSYMIYKKA